jgi:site-specific recombinase XerC
LFKQSSPAAHEIVLGFRHHLTAARLSAASVNRHLATLRSVSKLGRMLGMMTWYLEVPGVKAQKRRHTTGPTIPEVQSMLAATSANTEAETRDYAIVLTFFALGLRVSELSGVNLETTDLARGTTWIKGKGRKEKELVPLPTAVVAALQRYLAHRGSQAGPLFHTRGQRGRRATAGLRRVPCSASCANSGRASACTSGVTACAIAASLRPWTRLARLVLA